VFGPGQQLFAGVHRIARRRTGQEKRRRDTPIKRKLRTSAIFESGTAAAILLSESALFFSYCRFCDISLPSDPIGFLIITEKVGVLLHKKGGK
jgi:hypothetical protein